MVNDQIAPSTEAPTQTFLIAAEEEENEEMKDIVSAISVGSIPLY